MGEDRSLPQAADSQWFPSSPHTPQPCSLQDTGTETRPSIRETVRMTAPPMATRTQETHKPVLCG